MHKIDLCLYKLTLSSRIAGVLNLQLKGQMKLAELGIQPIGLCMGQEIRHWESSDKIPSPVWWVAGRP